MKKKLSILLTFTLAIVFSLCAFACSQDAGNEFKPETNPGTLTIANVTVREGESVGINPAFSDRRYAIDYTYEGDAISISANAVTGLTAGTTTMVTATTAHHSTTFTVTVTDSVVTEYGTLTVTDVTNLEVGASADINAVFSIASKAEEITYSYESDAISIENGKVTALKAGAHVMVTATTAHHKDVFAVGTVEKYVDYGTLTVADVLWLKAGDSKALDVEFSNQEFAGDLKYTFAGNAISIEDGVVTALKGGQTVIVKATGAHHSVTFTVTTKVDRGEVEIADVTTWTGVAAEFTPVFSIPENAEELSYEYDASALEIDLESNTVKGLEAGKYTVTASSESFNATFTVNVKTVDTGATDNKGNSSYSASTYADRANSRAGSWEQKGNAGVTTVFIGDSFFDDSFWTNFYDEEYYGGKDALRLGISATTSYDWETWIEGWLSETDPKNIVMHMGTNNVYDDGDDALTAIDNLQRMFTMMHEKLPNANIYWFSISQRSYNPTLQAIVTTVNASMKEWCEDKDWITYIHTVDTLTADMLKDSVHPKPECYYVFRDALAATDIEIADLPKETGIKMENVVGRDSTFDPATGEIVVPTYNARNVVYLKNDGEFHSGNFLVSGTATMTAAQGGNPWMALFVNSAPADTWFGAGKALPMANIVFGDGRSQMWGHFAGGNNGTIGAFNKVVNRTYDFTVVSYNGTIVYMIGDQFKVITHEEFNNVYFGIVSENCTFNSTLTISLNDDEIAAWMKGIEKDIYGTLTVNNVAKLEVGESATINAVFSKPEKAEEITYSFEGNAISIKDGVVTALEADKVVIVTATSAHHTVKFSVSTRAYDYGALTVSDVTLEEGTTAAISPVFSIEGREEEITYSFEGDAIAIENGVITALRGEEVVTVTVTTEHHSATFTVTTTAINYGKLTVGNVYVEIGETANIISVFSKPEYKEEISYTYEENDAVVFNGNTVTALTAGAKIVVTATTAHHSATFTVVTTEIDYGELIIEDVENLTEGKTANIDVTFTRPKRTEGITYSFEGNAISIEDGVITALVGDQEVVVTATTAHHSATFTVTTTNIDYGELIIEDVEVMEGYTANIETLFTVEEWACDITYSFNSEAISIEGGVITAVDGGNTVTVTATTAHHSATFDVVVTIDWGTVSISDITAWVDYPASDFVVSFTRPKRAEALTYTYDETALTVNTLNNTVTALKAGEYTVTASSEHHSATFTVKAETVDTTTAKYDDSKYNTATKAAIYSNDTVNGRTTVFIGDSFFDTSFWSNFYDVSYPTSDALCLGVSATTSYDWEQWATEWLAEKSPANIVMHMGTNNIYDDKDDAATAISSLKRMFTVMHSELPSTNIYWFSISQRSNTTYATVVTEVNAAMKAWCDEREWITYVHTVDDLTTDKLKDGVHPKLEHYTVFTEALAETDISIYEKTGYGFGTVAQGPIAYNAGTKVYTATSAGGRTVAYLKNGNAFYGGSFVVSGTLTYNGGTGGWAGLFVNSAPVDTWFASDRTLPVANIAFASGGTSIWGHNSGNGTNANYGSFTNHTGGSFNFTVMASGHSIVYIVNDEIKVIRDYSITDTYFGFVVENNSISVKITDIKTGEAADAYVEATPDAFMKHVKNGTAFNDVDAKTYAATCSSGRTVSYVMQNGKFYNGNMVIRGTTTYKGGWHAMFVNSEAADTWFKADQKLPMAHIAFDNGNSQMWGNMNGGARGNNFTNIVNKTYTFEVVSYNGVVVYRVNDEVFYYTSMGNPYFGFVSENCTVNISNLVIKTDDKSVMEAFSKRVAKWGVNAAPMNFTQNGEVINKEAIITAKLTVTGFPAGSNNHVVFEVNGSNDRFILWNNNNGNTFNCAYKHNAGSYTNNPAANDKFTKPADGDLVLDVKILVTDNDVYFYVNDELRMVYINASTINLRFTSQDDDCYLSDINVISKKYNEAQYNAAIATGDLASAIATHGSKTGSTIIYA